MVLGVNVDCTVLKMLEEQNHFNYPSMDPPMRAVNVHIAKT